MSIDGLVHNYVKDNNVIITSAPGNGTTSLVQAIMDRLCLDQPTLYYSPCSSFDREFVEKHYKNAFNNVCFMSGGIEEFMEFIAQSVMTKEPFKYVIIDPADFLLKYDNIFLHLSNIFKMAKTNLICTSQIRQDLSNGGQMYSTIGRWNRLHINENVFKYSIWIRNVTGHDPFYNSKYADIFPMFKQGNRYLDRYIIKFQKREGYVAA
jgi:hypothetical protein